MATPTGIELIDTIHEELLKSCELTGIWEKKLRVNGIDMDILRCNVFQINVVELRTAFHI